MWPILFFGRLRHCKLCRYYYNLYDKRKKESVISALETSSSLLFRWFNNNFIKSDSDKSHLAMSCAEETTAVIDGLPIDSSITEVLLGITIGHKFKFDDHLKKKKKKQVQNLMHLPVLHLLWMLAKNELSWSYLLNCSLGTVLWYGCSIKEDSIIK